MKTTLNISDRTWKDLKQEAARRGRTMSEMVEAAIRLFLREPESKVDLPPLPAFRTGGARVDIADREALYEQMD
jgi:hypothetical protein